MLCIILLICIFIYSAGLGACVIISLLHNIILYQDQRCIGRPELIQTTMSSSFLRDHPDLRPILLTNVRLTGTTIWSGPYGSVEEASIPGAVCVAKRVHEFNRDSTKMPDIDIRRVENLYAQQCLLMSKLHHPNIVQFLGVCTLPNSRMPALVTEKLVTSLHEIMSPESPSPTKPFIPLSMKLSALLDVSHGMSFLHSHCPPVVHRKLSATNVLFNEGMVAKIADAGEASFWSCISAPITSPAVLAYLPPEALGDMSKDDTATDIFSIGIITIFTLSQTFPKPLPAVYVDEKGKSVERTELERRSDYMQEILRQFPQKCHPMIQMIEQCLKNEKEERPTVQQVIHWLRLIKCDIQDDEYDIHKLSLARLLQSKHQCIQQQQQVMKSQKHHIQVQKAQSNTLNDEIYGQRKRIQALEEQVQTLEAENAALKSNKVSSFSIPFLFIFPIPTSTSHGITMNCLSHFTPFTCFEVIEYNSIFTQSQTCLSCLAHSLLCRCNHCDGLCP